MNEQTKTRLAEIARECEAACRAADQYAAEFNSQAEACCIWTAGVRAEAAFAMACASVELK